TTKDACLGEAGTDMSGGYPSAAARLCALTATLRFKNASRAAASSCAASACRLGLRSCRTGLHGGPDYQGPIAVAPIGTQSF
ncbi:MAG TPA: hypothetical protein VMT89_12590, partial [Candidatus Acidoferrales bacterium]|nr:hypothetical protein [Candidatus Acidoferrales bacterium]